MKILLKISVLCLLIGTAVPVFAAPRQYTLSGKTNTAVTNPNHQFITYGNSIDATARIPQSSGVNGTCDAPANAPVFYQTGNFRRKTFGISTFGQTSTQDECVTVKIHGVFNGNRYSVSAHSTPPNANAPGEGLLGYTRNWVENYGDVQFFSFRKPASLGSYYLAIYGIDDDNADFTYNIEISRSLAAPSDFDGDGQTDSAVFRPSTGAWYILQSATNTLRVDFFGTNGDVPLDGDFDGDGKSDTAVFRPSNGTWYYRRSYNNSVFGAFFGLGTDKPVPGDYDKDGITDIGAYRDGQWLLSPSSGMHTQVTGYSFGTAGDIPVGSQRK